MILNTLYSFIFGLEVSQKQDAVTCVQSAYLIGMMRIANDLHVTFVEYLAVLRWYFTLRE